MNNYNRRKFIALSAAAGTATTIGAMIPNAFAQNSSDLKISLAQWSLHRAYRDGSLDPKNFAADTKDMFNLDAIEYVSDFYANEKHNASYWKEMRKIADDQGVTSLLIMIDGEGELGSSSDTDRTQSIDRHKPWIDAAREMGCHSVRVNAFGKGTDTAIKAALVNGLGRLTEYGEKLGINVLVENHGLQTSNAAFMVDVIKQVNNPYLGTLPDFGNWCISKEWGGTENNSCSYMYDPYRGVEEYLPYAKGVSAKAYAFDKDGNETQMDYRRMLKLVKDAGFQGHIGIEYEGQHLSEPDGIRATKALLEKAWKSL
ncbi:sugar phosphate isomerase/epimerase family protein [Pseudemcibacter aquimaris]|uniref:sugar phosphate isomerase/epimerase family protein n=1 Tax=Pseudemcibacter aquimaris TaxID=2857064 RepID=UPI0020110369|nr:TIM barrel protein [Pseudemcibacter aquimaris]MCC3861102.1 sugar phosphate isomerase/epimerase [Pseudemcibacter aquimaris]WDU59920.1 sugar phosphate isomerase/epimerase [Pseudemcibacter aquimaris]